MNFYLNHLNHDSDYWTKCDQVPAPNASELNPVNQQWDGKGTDPRRWRTLPGTTAQYTVELLPATGYDKCVPGDQKSFVDLKTGTFRLRFTGRPSPTSTQRRSIVATFRREGFLDFLYFTNYEDLDPQALVSASARANAQANCADRYRSQRPASAGCTEIQFITGDHQNGPLHSNDTLLVCGSPTFGRDTNDKIEIAQPKPGIVGPSGCTASPVMQGVFKENAKSMEMPATNTSLQTAAQASGVLLTGKSIIRLNANDTMTVTTFPAPSYAAQTQTMAMPTNGVIYVRNDPNSGCTPEYPTAATYTESVACGNAYVSGQYARSLTIGAENDIIIAPTSGGVLTGSNDANLTRTNDSTLGLIANNFVRVGHRVDRTAKTNINTSQYPLVSNVRIDAAILSLRHSFIVDNYDIGASLGSLTVTGAIAQKYRGPVGTGTGTTGYLKNYNYDDRLRYRSPPSFLDPVDAAWNVLRTNEQVPAR
jgi:hypothetical protein